MKTRKSNLMILQLGYANFIFTLVLFVLNLIAIIWVNRYISLNQIAYISLSIFIIFFEFIRMTLLIITGIILLILNHSKIKFKLILISILLGGILLILFFLIKLFALFCYTPMLFFLSFPIIVLYLLLIIFNFKR
jgi:hypothetical protein